MLDPEVLPSFEPRQFQTPQLLHTAPPAGRFLSGFAAVLPESSPLPAQPAPRACRQESDPADDRTRPPSLAHAARPGANSTPASLTKGGRQASFSMTLHS